HFPFVRMILLALSHFAMYIQASHELQYSFMVEFYAFCVQFIRDTAVAVTSVVLCKYFRYLFLRFAILVRSAFFQMIIECAASKRGDFEQRIELICLP